MTTNSSGRRGSVARRITLAQRDALLKRLRAEVDGVVEEIQAIAESLRAIDAAKHDPTQTELATLHLLRDEQQRQQLELRRLFGEYETLALRRAPSASSQGPSAA